MTLFFTVSVDVTEGRVSPVRMARAMARVLTHAQDVDIEGAEYLDHRVGSIQVTPAKGATK